MTMLIINDSNYRQYCGDGREVELDGQVRLLGGCLERSSVYGAIPWAKPSAEYIPTIPRSEWADRIKGGQGNWLSDMIEKAGVASYDQDGTNYCHAHATALGMIAVDLVMHQPGRIYAPESVGGPITDFRNEGAELVDDLAQVREGGICRREFIPENVLDPRQWDAGWTEDALLHRLAEWYDVGDPNRRRVFDEVMTLLFLRIPVIAGYRWWRHAVCLLDPVLLPNGRFGVKGRNSWGASFGTNGYFVLQEGKGTPDLGAFAPTQATPSEV
jgi:hypothetical protein